MYINLNDTVEVRLAPKAHEILRANHQRQFEGIPNPPAFQAPPEDSDGWSSWPLWRLMLVLGPHLGMGTEQLIHENQVRYRHDFFLDPPDPQLAIDELANSLASWGESLQASLDGLHAAFDHGEIEHHTLSNGQNYWIRRRPDGTAQVSFGSAWMDAHAVDAGLFVTAPSYSSGSSSPPRTF